MKTISRVLFTCVVALAASSPIWAGGPPVSRPGGPPVDVDAADDEAAIAKIATDDLDGAAAAEASRNTTPNGTLPWYQQSASALFRRAYIYRAAGDYERSQRAALAGIKLLTAASEKKASGAHADDRAELFNQLGRAYEEFTGDRAAARESYAQALQESPSNDAARQALARCDNEAANRKRILRRGP